MVRQTREQQVMSILTAKGHISEATGFAELGRVHVGGAIFRIKNRYPHMIPAGKEIVSVPKLDTQGNRFVEWRLQAVAA